MSFGLLFGIIILLAILSGIADAPRKIAKSSQVSGNDAAGCGCLALVGIVLALGVISMLADFAKAHSAGIFFVGMLSAFIALVAFIARKSDSDKPSVDFPPKAETPPKKNIQEQAKPEARFPAALNEVVGEIKKRPILVTPEEIAGKEGEDNVAKAVWSACLVDKRHHRILRNVYIRKPNGKHTEIDVLLLHESGVYVFESKNFSGTIYADRDASEWKRFKDDGQKDFFPNPIKQNAGHIAALRRFLRQDERNFRVFNLVVFGRKASLKNKPEDFDNVSVHYIFDLEMDLVKKMAVGSSIYSAEMIDDWLRKLLPGTLVPESVKQAHANRIKAR